MIKLQTNHRLYIVLLLCGLCSILPAKAQKRKKKKRRYDTKILVHNKALNIRPLSWLNSPNRETNVCVSPDHKMLLFMSSRPSATSSSPGYMRYKGRMENDGNIYLSYKRNGNWQKPTLMRGVAGKNGEDEPNISLDGSIFYLQSWSNNWMLRGGPYYAVIQDSKGGTILKGFGGGISYAFARGIVARSTDGSTISPDGKTFIVAIGKYNSNMNLYMSRKNSRGEWGKLRKMKVSTRKNERSPKIALDGKTLYFSSNGYRGGFGGLDVYKTTLNADGTTGEVINVGFPINTAKDDLSLTIDMKEDKGYFVREGDIYEADLSQANPLIKPDSLIQVRGFVAEAKKYQPLINTQVICRLVGSKQVLSTTRTNAKGYFAHIIPFTQEALEIEIVDKRYPSRVIRLPKVKKEHYQEMTKRVVLGKK